MKSWMHRARTVSARRVLVLVVAVLVLVPAVASAASLMGTPGNDAMTGTSGDDSIFALAGSDTINAAAGNDDIDGGAGADDIHGGPGTDAVLYGGRTAPVKVTLDNAANDGQAGEGDNVHSDIEQIYGGNGDDQLTGNDRANLIDGGPGDDAIFGGGGADRLYGGAGNDVITSFDGVVDVVDCGPGNDTVTADRNDVLLGCERRVPAPRVRSVVDFNFTFRGALTTVDRLTVRNIPSAGAVVVACRGGGCPFATNRTKLKQGQRRAALAKLFSGRRLHAGATLDVRVTATGMIGRVHRFRMRRGKEPADSLLCLTPGSNRAKKTC